MTVNEKCLARLPTLQGGKITGRFPSQEISVEDPFPLSLLFVSLHFTVGLIPIPKSRARQAREGRNWRAWTGEGNSESNASALRKRITDSVGLPSHKFELTNVADIKPPFC